MVAKCIKSAKIALKFKTHAIAYTVVHCRTSNIDRRRGPKQKLRAGYTALSLKTHVLTVRRAFMCTHHIIHRGASTLVLLLH